MGPWRAWLDSPGGNLPFGLELAAEGKELSAWLINGSERIPVNRVTRAGDEITFHIDHYDSRIVARRSSADRLDGEWSKQAGKDKLSRLPFHAEAGEGRAGPIDWKVIGTPLPGRSDPTVEGRWAVRFESSEDVAVGIFESSLPASRYHLRGTFLTTTGDYRFLEGYFDGAKEMYLSCFDGAHAFLFRAKLGADGILRGDFWSRDTWHETWTAQRDDDIELPDPFAQTTWDPATSLSALRYPDLDGRVRALDDPEFQGKARLIYVFGTWCPNCSDATDYLVQLYRRYGERGLSILGLAFEVTGDLERDTRQVRTYTQHKGVEFPVLVAGLSDKSKATEAFPALDRVRSYPTTIFMREDGRVRAVHSGFTGPATGAAFERLRRDFEARIEEMLSEAEAAGR